MSYSEALKGATLVAEEVKKETKKEFNRFDYPELRATLIDTGGQPLSVELLDRLRDTLEAHNPSGPIVPSDELIERLLKIPADEEARITREGMDSIVRESIKMKLNPVYKLNKDAIPKFELRPLYREGLKYYIPGTPDYEPINRAETGASGTAFVETSFYGFKGQAQPKFKPKRLTKKRKEELMRKTKEQLIKEIEQLTSERDNLRRQFTEMGDIANSRLVDNAALKNAIDYDASRIKRLEADQSSMNKRGQELFAENAKLRDANAALVKTAETDTCTIQHLKDQLDGRMGQLRDRDNFIEGMKVAIRISASKGKRL